MRSLEDITVLQIWNVFKRKYPIVIGSALIVGLSVWLFCKFFVPPTYCATVSLYAWDGYNEAIDDGKNGSLNGTRDLAFAD